MTRRALFVADAGPGAGLGHVSRSSAVAMALAVRGFTTRLLAYGTETSIERDGLIWEPFDQTEVGDCDVVVLDSYDLSADQLEVGDARAPLVVLQEATAPPREARLVVNASADPAEAGPGRLYGFAYAALRPHFWGASPARPRERVEHVLVTTGAGDVGGAGPTLAAAVRSAVQGARVTVVRGPFAEWDDIEGFDIAVAPDSLLELLLDADMVLCAGGQTMLEAAAVGAPCIAVPLVENQLAQVSRLAELGAVRVARLDDAASAVAELASDVLTRSVLASRAQQVVDGFGALRVAYAISLICAGVLGDHRGARAISSRSEQGGGVVAAPWQQWEKRPEVEGTLVARARGELPEMESTRQLVDLVAAAYEPGMRVLDVGCNTGHYLRGLRRIDAELQYVGVDAYPHYIEQAQTIFADDPRATFEVKDIHEPLYPSEPFDIVFCCNVVLHLPDFRTPLRNLLDSTSGVCFVRTLLGDRTTKVRRAVVEEFDVEGEPLEFIFQNTWARETVVSFASSLGWDADIVADEFDPSVLEREFSTVKKGEGTGVLGGKQVDGVVLFNWEWLRLTPAEA